MQGIASHAPRSKALGRPKVLGNRRSGRAGESAAGESVGASESLDDAPQDPRLPSDPPDGPPHRPSDLYVSLSTPLGIILAGQTPDLLKAADLSGPLLGGHLRRGHRQARRLAPAQRHECLGAGASFTQIRLGLPGTKRRWWRADHAHHRAAGCTDTLAIV